jgi:glutathione S-transferase
VRQESAANTRTSVQQLVEKLLRQPSASLRGARSLAYLSDMSRLLRAVRLASGRLATFFNRLLASHHRTFRDLLQHHFCGAAADALHAGVAAHALDGAFADVAETGVDFTSVNPKGTVPGLRRDNGEYLTACAVRLQWIADQKSGGGLASAAGTRR